MDLSNLSIEELKLLISEAEQFIRIKEIEAKSLREKQSRNNLSIGDTVSVTGDKFRNETMTVLKLNPKKVHCERKNGEVWNIPYSHIIL